MHALLFFLYSDANGVEGGTLARGVGQSRFLPWEGGVKRSLQEGKVGCFLVQSDGRGDCYYYCCRTAVLEGVRRFMSDWKTGTCTIPCRRAK